MQRLRITFARGEGVKYLSHLELMRLWERAFRRAGWRLAYSQGFSPHPRLSFASALPVGVASEAELMEVYLEEARPVEEADRDLARRMPRDLEVLRVQEVPGEAPPLQRLMVAAEYRALCPKGLSEDEACRRVERLLTADSLPRERVKEGKIRVYDLRPKIRSLVAGEGAGGRPLLRMELRADAQGAGRPDEVLREMGIDPADCEITRVRLVLNAE